MPADRRIAPPLLAFADESPATTFTLPPGPVSPPPTDRTTLPPAPPIAGPDTTEIAPALPEMVAPVLSAMLPLAPEAAAFAVSTMTVPLDDARPCPLVRRKEPPRAFSLAPPLR